MTQRFENKVVIITGGAMGIGKACAIAFAQEGGQVSIADITEKEGLETIREIEALGGDAIFSK